MFRPNLKKFLILRYHVHEKHTHSLWCHCDLDLWPRLPKCERIPWRCSKDITFTRWTHKLCFVSSLWPWSSNHPRVQVNICTKFEEIPSRHSWDIAFTRMDGQPENIMPLATGCTQVRWYSGTHQCYNFTTSPINILYGHNAHAGHYCKQFKVSVWDLI